MSEYSNKVNDLKIAIKDNKNTLSILKNIFLLSLLIALVLDKIIN